MKNSSVAKNSVKCNLDAIIQEAFEILDAEDGKSFEEKKEAVLKRFRESSASQIADTLVNLAFAERTGAQTKQKFWAAGETINADRDIVLRNVVPSDRKGYLDLQQEYSEMKEMLKEEAYCDLTWNEHTGDKALTFSIVRNGAYIGYCGINNITLEPWEIGIEIQPEWTKHGIGGIAITAMLNEIRSRLGVTEYRVRIDPRNYASQRLFEKLGATPNGITELWIRDQEMLVRCEEDNLEQIDDPLISVSEKFGVEPRKLLSHVLEYKLTWE